MAKKAAKKARPAARTAGADRKSASRAAARKTGATRKTSAAKKETAPKPGAKKPSARLVATGAAKPTKKPAPKPMAAKPGARRRGAVATRAGRRRPSASARHADPQPLTMLDVGGPTAVAGLSEEDQIREAKYLPRELPKRLFEEERFVFPETYGVNRIRLLVRDPEWIFAYWDVNLEAMKDLARNVGERSLALSRLTLRIVDPVSGAVRDILLPPGARWWYVRTDAARRKYRAELGITLPSGEYRRLAGSNTVVTPRVGPSAVAARRRLSYAQARELPLSAAEAAAAEDGRSGLAGTPWAAGSLAGAAEPAEPTAKKQKGGASDAFGPGVASARPGASDGFRR
jgi:hypothetical protein